MKSANPQLPVTTRFEAPTLDALREIAQARELPISGEDVETYAGIASMMTAAYHVLDQMPDPAIPPLPERDWRRPAPDANPHNAWYVQTEIQTASSGALAGKRVVLKDNVMLAGVPMLNGSKIFTDFVADVDATIVTRLLDAGAVIAGKAHCEDLCVSGGSHTNATGFVHNPHRHGHSAGGSSSGSAVLVATGEVDLAIGGDQGGSIRMPSAMCGTVGMKPTWGLVPYTGIAPIEPLLDHVGPITPDVQSNAALLQVIAGPDGIDGRQSGAPAGDYLGALEQGAAGLRIGVLEEGFGHPNSMPEVDACVRDAATKLGALGATVSALSLPIHRQASLLTLPLMMDGMFRNAFEGDGVGSGRTDLYSPAYMERMRGWRQHTDELAPIVGAIALAGAYVHERYGVAYYGKAVHWAREIRAAYDAALHDVDCLLMPTCPLTAPPLPAADASLGERFGRASEPSANTQPFDATHHPALSVPCGTVDGLPVGLMLVGRHHEEALLYRIAHAFEQAAS
jgi:amidase